MWQCVRCLCCEMLTTMKLRSHYLTYYFLLLHERSSYSTFLAHFLLYDTVLVTVVAVMYIKPQTYLVSESWNLSINIPCSPQLPSYPPPVINLRLYQSTQMSEFFLSFFTSLFCQAYFLFWKNVDYSLALSLRLYSVGSSLSSFPWLRS